MNEQLVLQSASADEVFRSEKRIKQQLGIERERDEMRAPLCYADCSAEGLEEELINARESIRHCMIYRCMPSWAGEI
jgi:hypothetical protein